MTLAAVMAPLVAIHVESNPTVGPAFEKSLRNMSRVNTLPVLLQLCHNLVVVVS